MGVNTFTLEIMVSYHYLPALKDKTDKTRPLHTIKILQQFFIKKLWKILPIYKIVKKIVAASVVVCEGLNGIWTQPVIKLTHQKVHLYRDTLEDDCRYSVSSLQNRLCKRVCELQQYDNIRQLQPTPS